MSEFKLYRKKHLQELRPYIPGENMVGISLSEPDSKLLTLDGGMIARNSKNHADRWYISAKFFEDNYELVE